MKKALILLLAGTATLAACATGGDSSSKADECTLPPVPDAPEVRPEMLAPNLSDSVYAAVIARDNIMMDWALEHRKLLKELGCK